MKTTAYFERRLRQDRQYLELDWVEGVIADPLRHEVQDDGRHRYWGEVPEFGNRILRVVTLDDGETVLNAFFDRDFRKRYTE